MSSVGLRTLAGMLLLALVPAHAAPPPPPATIKDLEGRQVEVRPDPPQGVDTAKTMDSYRRFLDLNAGDSDLRAEALRRLGDLNLESAESARIEVELANNEALRAGEAITLYTALLKTYPKFERNDSVLYQLARAYETNLQPEQALATLDRLVATYPASRFIDEAQFRRGELLFSARQYPAAQAAYEAVISFGARSQFYDQSLYKHGWSLFKQGENERSLNSFAAVLDSLLVSKRDAGALIEVESLSRPNQELVEDTLRVMSITFSYTDGARTLDAFLATMKPRPYAYVLYARLGDLYGEKERYTDAADSYRAFAARNRNHEKAPLLEMQAIEAYSRGGFAQLVLQGKQEFVENYSFGTPYWEGRDPEHETRVVTELKANLRDLAQYYHAQAQHSKAVADYQEAAKWYRSYLKSFPHDPDASVTNYLLADTLFDSRQYLDAAKEYEQTAYGYGEHAKAPDAGYAAIVAYGKHEETVSGDEKAGVHRQSVDSSLKFAATFPQHPESATVLMRAAKDLYAAHDYPRALAAAEKLLARRPPVDVLKQRVAWTVIANANFEQGAFAPAETAYTNAKALMPNEDPERAAIDERLAASIYKQGEQKNQAGDAAAAVEDFLRVSLLAPSAKIRVNADYDAAALLIGAQQWDRAIVVLEGFRGNFPHSELQPEVTRKLAVAYSEAHRPAAAAVEFERISQTAAEPPDVQREAIERAAALYEEAGDLPKARAMLETFVRRYPQPLDAAMEARNKLAGMAARGGDEAGRAHWLHEIIAADRAAGAQRSERSRWLAGNATLTLAIPAREEFRRIKLVAPLKKSLSAKRSALEEALKAYSQAADYQIAAVTTAATFESAELYRQLGKDLIDSQRPKNLSADELEQYNVLLEEQAFPFEEKAIKLHEVNTARTSDGIYDEWVQKSFDALAQLNPGRYAKAELDAVPVPADAASAPAAPEAVVANAQGVAQRKLGKFADADAAYRHALELDQNFAPAHLNLGILCDLYRADPQEALLQYQQYVAIAGENKRVNGWIAELRKRLGIAPPPSPNPTPAPVAAHQESP
ncbi:MAG: tetratricopeptide repeat protein [Steroidobacterales bacterium]